MLQSIGMTTKQLRSMLMTEGLFYTASAGIFSAALGIILSLVCVRAFTESLWFFTYQFTLVPLAVTVPILLIIGAALPAIVLKTVTKQSVVERLRESE